MAARTEVVPRDFFVLELRSVSGKAGQHSLPAGREEQSGGRPYTERQRPGRGPCLGCDRRELPAGRRWCDYPGSPAALHRRGADNAEEVLTLKLLASAAQIKRAEG